VAPVKPRVLAFCQQNIPSVQVGVTGPLAALDRAGILSYRFVATPDLEASELADSDIVGCVRGAEPRDVEIVAEASRLGKFAIYYLDDDLLDVPASATCYEYYHRDETRQRVTALLGTVNCLWVVNDRLRERYRGLSPRAMRTNAPALLLEAGGPPAQARRVPEGGVVTIGYAGGIDHRAFLQEMLELPVRTLAEEYGERVHFEFFGARPGFISRTPARHIPYRKDFASYAQTMRERRWDIALAPLPRSSFHACKYFNKYMEYGAIGAAGVYSRVEPYLGVIRDGVNGILVENDPVSWREAIRRLILDTACRTSIADNAYRDLATRYTPQAVAGDVLDQCPELGSHRAPPCAAEDVHFTTPVRGTPLQRGIELLRREKWRAFPLLARRIKLFVETGY
jgi:hypothetical protein